MIASATTWDPITNQTQPILLMSGGETAVNVSVYAEELLMNVNKEDTDFWDPIIATHYRPPKSVSSANSLVSFGLIFVATQTLLGLLFWKAKDSKITNLIYIN